MAIFSSNVSQLKTADLSGLKSIDIHDFGFRGKTREGDFMSQLDRMTEAMREKQAQQRSDIALEEVDFGSELAEEGFEHTETTLDSLLRQAKKFIADAQYEAAIRPLSEVLQINPNHHEGRYLFAYCHARLDHFESALRALQSLRHTRINNALQARILALKTEMRDRMLLGVYFENYLLLQTGRYELAIDRLQYVIELDPEVGIYHYMLPGSMMELARFEQAIAAVNDGLNECASDQHPMLLTLRSNIERRYVARQMEPAREKFKQGQYGRTRRLLNQIAPAYRHVALYVSFATYVAQLDSGGLLGYFRRSAPPTFAPQGKARDAEDLCFFLIQEEIDAAKPLMRDGRYDLAEKLLRPAVTRTPNFPYIHYLYAGCIYSRVMQQITSGTPPDLDQTIADIKLAHQYAQIGAADKEITDATALLSVISDIDEQLKAVVGDRKKREKEIALVNDVIAEFQSLMAQAEGGITSPEQYRSIEGQMQKLKAKVSSVRKQIHSDDGKDALKQLADVIERNLKQLKGLSAEIKEAEEVRGCYDRFNSRMKSLTEYGIRSYDDFIEAQTFFRLLKSDAERIKSKLQQPDARTRITELIGAIDLMLKKLSAK